MNIQKKNFSDDDDYEVKIWIENCTKWKLHFRDNLLDVSIYEFSRVFVNKYHFLSSFENFYAYFENNFAFCCDAEHSLS